MECNYGPLCTLTCTAIARQREESVVRVLNSSPQCLAESYKLLKCNVYPN